MTQSVNHFALLPLYAAAGTALLVLVLELAFGRWAVPAGIAGALATAGAALAVGIRHGSTFCGLGKPMGDVQPGYCSWSETSTATVATVLFAALTIGVLALSAPALRAGIAPPGEFCFLLACSMTGGVVVGYAGDLITLIVGLETLTLPLYVLVGLRRFARHERPSSTGASAAVTFYLVSVVSTAVALLGAALLYAANGELWLKSLTTSAGPLTPVATVGAALLVIGFGFKIAAVPLHAWAPATYDGAAVPVAAYLSTASKLGGVVALTAVVGLGGWQGGLDSGPVLAVLAVLTMTVGNLVALRQTRMVRLLAWSSVAQAGYILAPLAMGEPGVTAALAYAVFFLAAEFVAFAAVVALRGTGRDGGEIDDYRGAGRRNPWLGAALVLAFASLAGLPPGLAGLFGKVTVVAALVDNGWGWLAVVVALNAVVALAYYVRAIAVLYHRPVTAGIPVAAGLPQPSGGATMTAVADPDLLEAAIRPRAEVPRAVVAALAVAALVTVVLGFAPQWVFEAL
jgi:NADH-quinone oxidoreductase subunit N